MSDDFVVLLNRLYSNLPSGKFFSITSFAKPYSLMALKDKVTTNRTFLAIITDGKYNGNDDYYGEIKYAKTDFSNEGNEEFKKAVKDVQTNYFCEFLSESVIYGGHIQLYEFIPLQQYFALESVLSYPHKIIAKRQKKGYSIDFSSTPIDNKDYVIQRMTLSLNNSDTILSIQDITPGQIISLPLSNKDINNSYLEIKTWVKFCDNIYNGTVLHPEGSKLQGSEGLTKIIVIEPEPKALILGVIPLSDFLFCMSFWTSSQNTAASVWGFILIIAVLACLYFLIRRSNIYKAKPSETKI